jgi:hypothetical protein
MGYESRVAEKAMGKNHYGQVSRQFLTIRAALYEAPFVLEVASLLRSESRVRPFGNAQVYVCPIQNKPSR